MSAPEPRTVADREPLLRIQNLAVDFSTSAGVVHAVRDVSLSIQPGQTLAILGESGSGKSVSALTVMGLLPKPAGSVVGGSIQFEGRQLVGMTEDDQRAIRGTRIGMIFQDPLSSLNPVFTVGAQIDEMFRSHLGVSKKEARRRTIELIDRVRIDRAGERANDYPHQFSGGMRQRIMIAMAIALKPSLLIADEPTTALDVTVQARIIDLLTELRDEEHMSLLFITHDLGVVAPLAEHVAVMYAGRIVETGPIQDVYEHPRHPYTAGLMGSLPTLSSHHDRLQPIPGNPPNMLHLPPGCAFAPRCAFRQARCQTAVPPLTEARPHHLDACIRSEEIHSQLQEIVR